MKIISVNVGLPREVFWKERKVITGIFKEPVTGRVMMRKLNMEGDRQADLSVHGGPEKAVYAYPAEHYEVWRHELPEIAFTPGIFGENLTIAGLREDDVCVGDRLLVGEAEVIVTQPRMPCYKLGIRFGRDDIIKRFLASGRSGLYFSVAREGTVAAGDEVEILERAEQRFSIAEMNHLYRDERTNADLMRRALQVAALPESWRGWLRERLEKLEGI